MRTRAGLLIVMLCGCVAPEAGFDGGGLVDAPNDTGPLPVCTPVTETPFCMMQDAGPGSGCADPDRYTALCPEGHTAVCGRSAWVLQVGAGGVRSCGVEGTGIRPECGVENAYAVGDCIDVAGQAGCLAPDPELRCPESYWRGR